MSSKELVATNQMQIGILEIKRLLGRLFSAVLSNITRRGYRIRTFINNTRNVPDGGQMFVRLLGCLSYETNPSDADFNRLDRRNKYVFLHTEVNSLVSLVKLSLCSLIFLIRKMSAVHVCDHV